MEAGPELDALVAEKVFGWKYFLSKHGHWIISVPGENHSREPLFGCIVKYDSETGKKLGTPPWWTDARVPEYSTDIAAAWLVVEKIGAVGFFLGGPGCYYPGSDGGETIEEWAASFDEGEMMEGPTPTLAICLAALDEVRMREAGEERRAAFAAMDKRP